MDKNLLIAGLEQELLSLEQKANSIRDTILTLKQSMAINGIISDNTQINTQKSGNAQIVDAAYQSIPTFREKLLYIFKTANRFLHYREIVELLTLKDPSIPLEKMKSSVSPALTFFKNKGVLVQVKATDSNLNVFWGSKNWVDANGSILEGYEYDKSQITTKENKDYEI